MEFLQSLHIGTFVNLGLCLLAGVIVLGLLAIFFGVRFIPNDRVAVVEKLWAPAGSVAEGRMIVVDSKAGFQAAVLRGGIHLGYWIWQYKIHKLSLAVVTQGKIGYVFARDGEPLAPDQTLGRIVPCNYFQDAKSFLLGDGSAHAVCGQRGRQRAILREGVYAINLAQFVVITEERIYAMTLDHQDAKTMERWRQELLAVGGFNPIVIGSRRQAAAAMQDDAQDKLTPGDDIGVVTIHDGPALDPGEIIAPPVGTDLHDPSYHNNYQDVEAFLRAGGRRGRQFVPLTDGTYFINRWFGTVELIPKTVVPIGHVGVVVSYFGKTGVDLSGESFRHGERVAEGARGVQTNTLCPGKYPFNAFAGHVHLVPTTNFVLHWITGRTESHRYDESLKSIDLVTADAYEPALPLSVVVHLDYQKAPAVVQRFGDIKKLITQTLDPMLSAYFRDIAHKKTMLQLLHQRDMIQDEARKELRSRFCEFDIELVDVLIGKPETTESSGQIETLLQQLRSRQLSREQIETYREQCAAAEKLQTLKRAQAEAEKQTELTNSRVEIDIAQNRAEAELAQARKRAEQTVVTAEAENRRKVLIAEADSRSQVLLGDAESKRLALLGEGQSTRVALEGQAEADVLRKKVESYGDPRLYALALVSQFLSQSQQPLVPAHLFVTGADDRQGATPAQGLLGTLIGLLVAEKSGHGGAESGKPKAEGGMGSG